MPTEQTKKKKQKTRRELRSTNCPSTWFFFFFLIAKYMVIPLLVSILFHFEIETSPVKR